jgi:hypothetical protein
MSTDFVILGGTATDGIFSNTLMSSFSENTHVEVSNNITTLNHNAGCNNYLYSMVIPDSVTVMRHHTWHNSIANLTYIVFKEFNTNMSAPDGPGGSYQISDNNKIFNSETEVSNVFIGKYRMVGTIDEINTAFRVYYIKGDLSTTSSNLEVSTISINSLIISPTSYTDTSTIGIITLIFSRPGMLQNEIETFLSVDSSIGTISELTTNDGITWEGKFTPNLINNLNCSIKFIYDKYDTYLNTTSNMFSVSTFSMALTSFALTPENLIDSDVSSTLRIEFNTSIPTDTNLNNYIELDPSYIATLGPMSDVSSGFVWEGVLTRTPNMNKIGNKLDFDFSYNGVEVSANLVYDVVEDSNLLYTYTSENHEITHDKNKITLAISGDGSIFAVGFPNNSTTTQYTNRGNVVMYDNVNDTWVEIQTIEGNPGSNRLFGTQVVLSYDGNILAISENSSTAQIVYTYKFDRERWVLGDIISKNASQFGYNMSISDNANTLAICAPTDNSYAGKFYFYSLNESFEWVPKGELLNGQCVAVSNDGNVVAIGDTMYNYSSTKTNTGRVKIYEFNESPVGWVQIGSDIVGDNEDDKIGHSLSLSSNGHILAVGSERYNSGRGKVTIYNYNTGWHPIHTFDGTKQYNKFANKISLSSNGTKIVISEPISIGYRGKVFMYEYETEWPTSPNYEISGKVSNEQLGYALSLSADGSRFIVGSFDRCIVYENTNKISQEATSITLDPSNIEYPDLSTNFAINLTTNDVLLTDIESKLSIDPSNVANISNTSLTNYGFTLEGQIDVSGEQNVSGVKLFYEDFSSNAFDIYSIQDLQINGFSFDNSAVTYENYQSNNITLTLNRSDLTNVDISNSLTIVPSSCGQIVDVSGTGLSREISFKPAFYINKPDCSLTFHFTNAQLDASMTIPFSVDTLQQIEDISMNPRSILEPTSSATLGVKFRLPVESSGTPDITITPSYIANVTSNPVISGDTWTGTISKTDDMNLLHNVIDFSYNGFDTSLNFNVAQNPELIVGPREIGDFVECKGIKISSVSSTEAFTVTEVIITTYDNTILLQDDAIYSSSAFSGTFSSIMDGTLETSYTISNSSDTFFRIMFTGINSRKIKDITIYASHSVKIELLGIQTTPDVDNIITNLGQLDIDVSGTMNIAEASKQSTITRKVQSLTMTPSNIALGVNSADFEVLFSTNDMLLNTIVANEYLTIDPSNIGTIISQSLDSNGFKLTGIFEPNTGFDTINNKLMYTESSDISGVLVFSLDSVQLEINDVTITPSDITYIDNLGTINVEFTRNVSVFTPDQIIINNSGSVSNLISIDGYQWQADVLFPRTDTNIDVNYQIDVSFNSDVSFNLTKTYNTYVPQISQITNDNSFDYIDTSGTILLEFDKALLQDVELTDLSYNAAKMDLGLNKLSDSSYNLIVDPSGEYTETQIITIKDYLGADSSNITLNIDTVVPSISEIKLNPNMLTYAATEGILDVKFNKKLLDRDQLVLTSSSNIGYSFKQQLNKPSASIVVTEVNNPHDPPLVNFTYKIEGDASENIVKSALQKWDNIITRHPIDVNNGAPGGTTKIHITFSVSEMDAGTLGYAYVDYVYYDDLNINGQIDYSDNIYTSSGFIALSQASYNSMISETRTDGNTTNTTLYYVLMHEIGHIIGIGPYFGHNNSPRVAYEESGVTKYYYTGVNALAKYRMYMNDASLVGIPIEDDGGAGTVNVHPEEHRIEGQTRHIGGHPHEGLDEELMTGWTESGNTIMPLSAVSIGFLQDMGYEVDYSYADEYKGINVNSNGDKILGSSLNSGANMKLTSGPYSTYSVVQYDVSVNYGIKNTEDISFNYRGNYDVSNIDIEVNTIIPDVSSIEIENILYTDASGIVTITFNDHDGNYFYGKDASMNIYLDPSVAVFSSIDMNPIPSDSKIWTGVITTISGEFYPDAELYLHHSGMDGIINVDMSANYRLDTDIRGLYITLPEMDARGIGTSQSINYLTYDHNTNKLETDVSFQFNIYVEGQNHDSRQFPYTDICDNFISISSNDLIPGDVVLDKGNGFTGRFWNGILTISGEVVGTFDICYNETLNPLRDDGVIEIREDKLTVNVNTKLPDISNVIVPDKLTYLDISGDVEIEFNKAILPGDENNIQIEYSLEDTNEYQFLDKYSENDVSGVDLKYVFNNVTYDANKKIALGIGTYTLNVPIGHPIFLTDNSLTDISISGTLGTVSGYHGTVTINVTGDFGTASYGCQNHGGMYETDRLVYKDVEVSSLAQNSATHWKYTLSLPQEIDTSLNVTIKYRDETSGPHIIPIYGIVPDVSSVTLSSTDLTYNDPSCIVTVEFNNALQNRTNIYDLISLEPSSELFIQSVSFSSIDKTVWTGILYISNNVENKFAYTDAKVSVNGIQSAAFGQGVSGEVLFNINTILPDISNVSISKMGYLNKTSNFTITFTKDDLNGYDISNSLSVPSDFTIANVGLISGNTLTGDIQQTGGSGLETDVSFIIDYTFSYRNDTLFKRIYRATDFEVDTRERGIKAFSLTNDNIINNVNSYLFTYLDNIGNLTLDFFTSDLSGTPILDSDMSFNSNINYSLSDNVINDTSLNAIMTVDMSQNAGPITFTYSDSEDRTSFQNNIFIDTRPRYITDITFSKTELTYVDKEGTLRITFNHNIFEDVDVITNLLNYSSSDLSLNNATITGSIWSCNLLSISELDGSFDVSLVYNGQTHSLSTPIILDTIIPRIDTSDNTVIDNKDITYFNKSTLVKITFTNDIESGSNITDTLKLQGVSDSSYSFVGNLDSTSKIEWNGQLRIEDWDISLSDVIIYSTYESTYEGETIVDHENLKIDINTKRPILKSSNITIIDKDKFSYLEPSGTLSITFEGESVLDTSINSFISTGSAITVGSMSRTDDTWTGNISINQHDISENQVVNITGYYGQNASISIPVMTILPHVDTISNVTNEYNYLELGSSREIEFDFSGQIFETDIATFVNNSISINNNDCSLNSFSRLTDNSIKANFVVNQETEIDDLKINFDYYSEYYDVSINQEFVLMNIETRIPNIEEATYISNTNLTYDASSTQLDLYFDAPLLDTSASSVLDASLNTSFETDPSINISPFEELSKTHYRANITTEYGIDKSEGNSVTVNYMDTSETLTFNVDTILRPYSNICFPRGEKVLTDNGYKNIEQIDINLDTIRGEKIEELTQTQTQEKELVLIKCGALMKNMPSKDTFITKNHKVFYKGKLVEAYKLVTLVESGVELIDYNGETLYNILLEGEKEGKMVVNGMIVETLSPTNNIAMLYKKIRKYGTNEYKKKRMVELFNQRKNKH